MVTVLIDEKILYIFLKKVGNGIRILFKTCKILPFPVVYFFFLNRYQPFTFHFRMLPLPELEFNFRGELLFSGDDIKLNVICFKLLLIPQRESSSSFFPAKIFFSFGAPTYFCLQFVKLWKTNLYGGL